MCRFAVNSLTLDGFRRKATSNTAARFSRVIRIIAAVGDCRVNPADQNEATNTTSIAQGNDGICEPLIASTRADQVAMGRIRTVVMSPDAFEKTLRLQPPSKIASYHCRVEPARLLPGNQQIVARPLRNSVARVSQC